MPIKITLIKTLEPIWGDDADLFPMSDDEIEVLLNEDFMSALEGAQLTIERISTQPDSEKESTDE